ncbi:oxidoreductase [Brevibacillus sp. SKDU10]|uniref:SDR family NAD(P)-dependent oxidoreductase n=1 Tax=Brevibacillus sp. SKDU10 TaxID=1247872 RepID=UPI0007C95751|nr:SDR family NAD(P)-dependent oxidoreductase [Brevibacillus sp. SKDU10]OAJ74959.1 oxidoreductase [Brevibacillus sp. SKDU10]
MSKPVVIVTGGTGGLGMALAKEYIREGYHVVITSRDHTKLKRVQREWNRPPMLHIYKLDLSDNEAVRAFSAWVKIRFDRCDILINNAGSALFKPFLDHSLEEIHQTIESNLLGTLYMTRAFLPMMLTQSEARIVNIASLAGRVASAKTAVYAATKAAVIRFSESLRHELAATHISVTCALPGPIDTPFLMYADNTGTYKQKVSGFLLSPEKTAKAIMKATKQKRFEVALPKRLHLLSLIYPLLPDFIMKRVAPLLNRK